MFLNHLGEEIGICLAGKVHLCKILPDGFRHRDSLHCGHDQSVIMANMKNMITRAILGHAQEGYKKGLRGGRQTRDF